MIDPQATTRSGTATPVIFFNTVPAVGQEQNAAGETHTLILQSLNRAIKYGTPEKPISIFYGVDNFTGTESAWDVTPAIYVADGTHPDMSLFSRDPQAALAKVKGRPAGTLAKSQVLVPGQPRLQSQITFSDPEVASLYTSGELGLSTALYASEKGGALSGKVVPNHVLLFKAGKTQPRDYGAMFLNSENSESNGGSDTVEKIDDVLTNFSNSLKNLFVGQSIDPAGSTPATDPEADKKLALANAALQSKDAEILAEKAAKEAAELALANTKTEIETFRQAEADKKWTELKNTIIPPAFVKTTTDEKTLREMYNADRDGFYHKIMNVQKKAPGTDSRKRGAEYVNTDEKSQRLAEANEAWNRQTGASPRQ